MSHQLELLTESLQWKTTTRVTPEIQKKEIKPFVILALKELSGNADSRISQIICVDKFAAIRKVVRHFARTKSAVKGPWNENDVKTFLDGLRFTPECVTELTTLLCKEQFYENIPRHLAVSPGVASLQWRIDVSLWHSTERELSKEVMFKKTYVILIFNLTNRQNLSYRISVGKFHELRFLIARALKNMIVLEKRKCMRKD